MTNVNSSSYIALSITKTTTTQSSGDQALFSLDTDTDSQSTTTSQSLTGGFSSGLSSNVLSALFNDDGTGIDPLDALFAAVNNDAKRNRSSSSNDTQDSIAAFLGISSSSSTSSSSDLFGLGTDDDFIRGAGPLPAFLAQVKAQLGLTSTQATSLDNIALQFKDADNTPETVQQIAAALSKAGITTA